MKKVLIDAYTAVNLGDDLFLKILFEKYPTCQFRLMASNKYKILFSSYSNVSIISSKHSVFMRIFIKAVSLFHKKWGEHLIYNKFKKLYQSELGKVDAYLHIGGSIFMQQGESISIGDQKNKLITDIFKDKPKFIIGANFGPYSTPDFFTYYQSIFKSYKDICFRERYSKELFSDFSNIRYAPDVVFQLKTEYLEKIRDSIGFSIIDLEKRKHLKEHTEAYFSFLKEMIISFINQGKKVYLYSFCKKEGDEKALNHLYNILNDNYKKQIKKVYYQGNMEQFLKIYSQMEVMFCSRFHSIILSLLYKQSIFPLVYSEKMTHVLKDLSYTGNMAWIKNINTVSIMDIQEKIYSNQVDIGFASILSNSQFEALDKFLKEDI